MALLTRQSEIGMRPLGKSLAWMEGYDDVFDRYIDCTNSHSSDIVSDRSAIDGPDICFIDSSLSDSTPSRENSPSYALDFEDQQSNDKGLWATPHFAGAGLASYLELTEQSPAPSFPRARKIAASKTTEFSLAASSTGILNHKLSGSSTTVSPPPSYIVRGRKRGDEGHCRAKSQIRSGISKSPGKRASRIMSYRRDLLEEAATRYQDGEQEQSAFLPTPPSPLPSGVVTLAESLSDFGFPFDDDEASETNSRQSQSKAIPPPTARRDLHSSYMAQTQTPCAHLDKNLHSDYGLRALNLPTSRNAPQQSFRSPISGHVDRNSWFSTPLQSTTAAPLSRAGWTSESLLLPNFSLGLAQHSQTAELIRLHEPNGSSNEIILPVDCNVTRLTADSLQSPFMDATFHDDSVHGPIVFPGEDYPELPVQKQRRCRKSSLSASPTSPSKSNLSHNRSRSLTHRRSKSIGNTNHRATSTGFVNFTPSDSKELLTGVAPSGSSKTKARRDREAAEKRRKLSEAAFRAVMEAGGDVEKLKEMGLTLGFKKE